MNQILLFIGLVIILCLTIKPVGKKLPFPTLLIFIVLGMLLGVNGPARIDFSDYALTETVCSTALLFIMFYGGFNTNIDRAKPVTAPAVLLSTLGVVATAGITGAFAHFVLGFDWIGGLLLGSVASTDAASVFSVLREHSLSLRGGTDSLLEVESGSNDPVAYMLTAVLATLAAGGDINIPVLLAKQIILGVGLGLAIGWASGRLIERARNSRGCADHLLVRRGHRRLRTAELSGGQRLFGRIPGRHCAGRERHHRQGRDGAFL